MIYGRHAKVSSKSDGADTSKVLPSDWNNDIIIIGYAPDALDSFDPVTGAALSTPTQSTSPIAFTTLDNSGAAGERLFQVKAIGDGSPEVQIYTGGVTPEGWCKYAFARSGDTADMRLTSSGSPGTDSTAVLLVDGVLDLYCPTFTVTTASVTVYVEDGMSGSGSMAGRTPDTVGAGTWSVLRGSWATGSGVASCSGGTGGDDQCIAVIDCGAANIDIYSTIISGPSKDVRLACNVQDADHCILGYAIDTTITIYKKTASGTYVVLVTSSCSALAASTPYACVLKRVNDDVWWTCNGTTLHYNVAGLVYGSETQHGIGTYVSGGVAFDSFKAQSP